jgi:hypothetical protein
MALFNYRADYFATQSIDFTTKSHRTHDAGEPWSSA